MAAVAAGTRVTLQGTNRPLVLRVLGQVELSGDWVVPVMTDAALLASAGVLDGPVEAQVATRSGPVLVTARLDAGPAGLVLRAPGMVVASLAEQRRNDVRGPVQLSLRGTLLTGTATGPFGASEVLSGSTVTVSAGGVCLRMDGGFEGASGSQLYLELEMPDGDLAPAVLDVVEADAGQLRGRFVDISPRDRERLVRLVFARQRMELAQRRRSRPN